MYYIFSVLLIVINCILFLGVGTQTSSFALYLNIFNVLSFPMLYMFISKKTINSVALNSYLKMASTNVTDGLKEKIIKELRYIFNRPVIYVLFFFPIILGLYFYSFESKGYMPYLIQLVLSFYLGLNLFVLSIILKLYYKEYFFYLISILGMIFISFVSIFDLVEVNLKIFTFSLILCVSLSVIAFYSRAKNAQ